MDTNRIKQLIARREEIDRELVELVTGNRPEKKPVRCSTCDGEGHTARSCPTKHQQAAAPQTNGHAVE